MKNIVILISGRGSNMEAIVRACHEEAWPARVAAVISNRKEALGLNFASAQGIPTVAVEGGEYASRAAFDQALAQEIEKFSPDLVLLAGFMRILTADFVERYRGRLLNIHPSLLPSFPGLHTHRCALEVGVAVHGATVHFVTPILDDGPIVAQSVVPVFPSDDVETLAARVLATEHVIYPRAVRWLIEEKVWLEGNHVISTLSQSRALLCA